MTRSELDSDMDNLRGCSVSDWLGSDYASCSHDVTMCFWMRALPSWGLFSF